MSFCVINYYKFNEFETIKIYHYKLLKNLNLKNKLYYRYNFSIIGIILVL